jgi:hypothetical protein|nr:hypothetical protein [uncultured Schaedlerella sp.]
MQNIDYEVLKDFIVLKCNEVLSIDISQSDKWDIPIFSICTGITAWGLIHIIDEVNKYYQFLYNPSDIIENPRFSFANFVESIHSQLLKE